MSSNETCENTVGLNKAQLKPDENETIWHFEIEFRQKKGKTVSSVAEQKAVKMKVYNSFSWLRGQLEDPREPRDPIHFHWVDPHPRRTHSRPTVPFRPDFLLPKQNECLVLKDHLEKWEVLQGKKREDRGGMKQCKRGNGGIFSLFSQRYGPEMALMGA